MLDRRDGFTLVEVVLAVAILAFGIVGVIHAYGISVRALSNQETAVNAIFLLGEKMADVEFEALMRDGVDSGVLNGVFGDGFDGFRWNVKVSPLMVPSKDDSSLEDSGLSKVVVTVYGAKDALSAHRFSLFTYMKTRNVNGSSG